METNQFDEWAEKYALGQMDGEEKSRFENLLAKDPSLLKRVNFYRELEQAIEYDNDVLQFRKVLTEVGHEYIQMERGKNNRKLLVRAFLAAAIFLLLLVTTILLKDIMNKPQSSAEIYAAYYHPYRSGITTMRSGSGNSSESETTEKAISLYEAGQYREAAVSFDQFLKANPGNHQALLYGGISQMELGKFQTAEAYFQMIIDQGYSIYFEQAEWYCGLCLIMQDDKNRAITYFSRLSNNSRYYQKQATAVLKALR